MRTEAVRQVGRGTPCPPSVPVVGRVPSRGVRIPRGRVIRAAMTAFLAHNFFFNFIMRDYAGLSGITRDAARFRPA
jgi:hypothetical protein